MNQYPSASSATPVSLTMAQEEPLIFEQSVPGRRGYDVPPLDVPPVDVDQLFGKLRRKKSAELPEVSEPQVMRHFVRMSQWNHAIDLGAYPLGSCTMKYNPRINEAVSRLEGFARLHPYMPAESIQGALALMKGLEEMLSSIAGLAHCSLHPAAGAQGELAGLMVMRAWQKQRGEGHRNLVIVPESAHGTNPASSALAGCKVIQVPINDRGQLDPERVAEVMNEDCVGLMITNPSTLGVFEEGIQEICEIVHARGGLVYLDGANMNAIQGIVRPGDMGIDVMHYNLHKTYSTPHGGGGPGAGPICVREDLGDFLPAPRIGQKEDGSYFWDTDRPLSIGRLKAFWGNFLVSVRAYAYIRALGPEGVRANAEMAVLNANYVRVGLSDLYHAPLSGACMHECLFSDHSFRGIAPDGKKLSTLDIAKRLIDYGVHPPTVYFPLSVSGALLIEPTESETKESLDDFIAIMRKVHEEAATEPELLRQAPTRAFRRRLDETTANRKPVLRWYPPA